MKHITFVSLVFVLLFVMFAVTASIGAADEDLERDALVALYNSTNGDGWDNNTGWLDPEIHHCDWFGVACDDENRVTILDLISNNLSGSIPPELCNLINLHRLDLAYNQLSAIPPELGNLINLETLILQMNQLNAIPPELGNLNNFQSLDLLGNRLKAIPPELGDLSNLQYLILTRNQLSGPIPSVLGNPSKLLHLDLSSNQLACWETQEVLDWANGLPSASRDYPYPGDVVCSPLIVTKTADTNDGTCDADCSLREAVEAANWFAGDDIITFNIPASDPGCTDINNCTITLLEDDHHAYLVHGPLTVSDSSGMMTINGKGSEIYIHNSSTVALWRDYNKMLLVEPGAVLTLKKLVLRTDGNIENNGTLNVYNSSISGANYFQRCSSDLPCEATGAILNTGTMNVDNSIFFNNRLGGLTVGGSICNKSTGSLNITNSTFSSNNAYTPWIAGLWNEGSVNIIYSSFFETSVTLSGEVTIGSSILAKSSCVDVGSGISTLTDCGGNISDDESCGFTQSSSRNNTDPRLDPVLANNGGPTMTHALWYDSPAIDTAVSASCPATDQRGVDRPQGAGCDSGAFELAPGDLDTSPVANPDSYAGYAGQLLLIAAPGVLENDSDADGDSLTAVLSTDVQHGTLALSSDGSFTYNADPGYIGDDSFLYYAFDGLDPSEPVTVTITINPSIVYLPVVLSE